MLRRTFIHRAYRVYMPWMKSRRVYSAKSQPQTPFEAMHSFGLRFDYLKPSASPNAIFYCNQYPCRLSLWSDHLQATTDLQIPDFTEISFVEDISRQLWSERLNSRHARSQLSMVPLRVSASHSLSDLVFGAKLGPFQSVAFV